ncbi:MAG: sigma-54 dependent transcriptional regulator [Rhodocyclaceae bacterium]
MTRPALPDILLVDDDPLIVETMRYILEHDFSLHCASNRKDAIGIIRGHDKPFDLALVNLGLPPVPNRPDEGLTLISDLLAHNPACKIIVLSGQNEEMHARHARTLGALEFIAKPARPEALRAALHGALRLQRDEQAADTRQRALDRFVGSSAAITGLREQLQRSATSPFPVLIEGESGTGKELAAHALHELAANGNRERRFVALNCAAIAPGLIEATLFGHARGAFTGAQAAQPGYFEEAEDGTLFLDEIGELPLELQPKLLRVLENGEFQRVGETTSRQAKARVVAATNRDLQQEVRMGRFRADLFHRLSVLRIRVPALRQTGRDREALLQHFTRLFAGQMNVQPFELDVEAAAVWHAYDFPGNVRELRNIVIRLLVRHAGSNVSRTALEAEMEADVGQPAASQATAIASEDPAPDVATMPMPAEGVDLPAVLRRIERDYIVAALQQSRGNMSQAARLLGINRSTLYNRMETLARNGEDFGNVSPGSMQ